MDAGTDWSATQTTGRALALSAVLPELLQRAERESQSYTDFALALLRAETNARKARRLSRILKRSRLATVEGLDGFNFALRPQLDPRVVKELLNARYAEERRNVLCLGKPGLGKTRVAKARTGQLGLVDTNPCGVDDGTIGSALPVVGR